MQTFHSDYYPLRLKCYWMCHELCVLLVMRWTRRRWRRTPVHAGQHWTSWGGRWRRDVDTLRTRCWRVTLGSCCPSPVAGSPTVLMSLSPCAVRNICAASSASPTSSLVTEPASSASPLHSSGLVALHVFLLTGVLCIETTAVRREVPLFCRYANFLITQRGISRWKSLHCRKWAGFVPTFRYFTGLWQTDRQTYADCPRATFIMPHIAQLNSVLSVAARLAQYSATVLMDLPRDALLARYMLLSRVRLPVRLSQAGIVSKRLDESTWVLA